MQTVLIVIHLLIVIALVIVVLLQRSEGGALGVGGGSGGFMTGRGQANVLTRATAILATLFFLTSLGLTLLARYGHQNQLNFNLPAGPAQQAPALPPKGQGSVLDQVRAIEQQRTGGAPKGTAATPAAGPTTPSTSTPASGTATPAPDATKSPAEPSGMPERRAPDAPQPTSAAPTSAAPTSAAPNVPVPAEPASPAAQPH